MSCFREYRDDDRGLRSWNLSGINVYPHDAHSDIMELV